MIEVAQLGKNASLVARLEVVGEERVRGMRSEVFDKPAAGPSTRHKNAANLQCTSLLEIPISDQSTSTRNLSH